MSYVSMFLILVVISASVKAYEEETPQNSSGIFLMSGFEYVEVVIFR